MTKRNFENLLHITVAAIPLTSSNFDLTHELRLLKAALLYADVVEFYSINSGLLFSLSQLGRIDGKKLLGLFSQIMKNDQLDKLSGYSKVISES